MKNLLLNVDVKKAVLLAILTSAALVGCQALPKNNSAMADAQKDIHDCVSNHGETWSVVKNQCVQLSRVADIRVQKPNDASSTVYAILSDDKQQAEIFGANLPEGTMFDAVKGGYMSKDGQLRLMNTPSGWKLLSLYRP
ncbi:MULTISPECIES: hypothetical protein [unclassified Acinetobacter]|uniref:hypothetical protein n=1 Tax=unclassified Acinetobacter TaxID=196816 RepID=UPI0035B90466